MNSIQKFQCSGYNFVIFSDHYCFDIGSWEKGKIITIYAKYYVAIQEQMLEQMQKYSNFIKLNF